MANDGIPRPDDRLRARQNNLVTYVTGHLADLGFAAVVMGDENPRRGSIMPEKCSAGPYSRNLPLTDSKEESHGKLHSRLRQPRL